MPANVKWQNVDFVKTDAYDWLERQFQNTMQSAKEGLEALRILAKADGSLNIPKKINTNLNASDIISQGDGTKTDFYYKCDFVPVKKLSVVIKYTAGGNAKTGTDDGNGVIKVGADTLGSIDYDTGWVTLTFTAQTGIPDSNTSISIEYVIGIEAAWSTVKGYLASAFVTLRSVCTDADKMNDPISNK